MSHSLRAQTAQKLRLNEAAKENALVMRSMLQANTAGDKEQFLLLGRCTRATQVVCVCVCVRAR